MMAATENISAAGGSTTTANNSDSINLSGHSLHAVVARNKSLWRPPQFWTQNHLKALSCLVLHHHHYDNNDNDNDNNDGFCFATHNNARHQHALIPYLTQKHLDCLIKTLAGAIPCQFKAIALNWMLVFPDPNQRFNNNDDNVKAAIPFSKYTPYNLTLTVGQRQYPLPELFKFHLGPSVVLLYLDSCQIAQPLRRFERSQQSYEPCIAAALVAMAQAQAKAKRNTTTTSGVKENRPLLSVVITQLLFTHCDDDQGMHVYTAYISQHLLERFQYPNKYPLLTPEQRQEQEQQQQQQPLPFSLFNLKHEYVPYTPSDSFRHRVLAAVSITATIMRDDDCSATNQRKQEKRKAATQLHHESGSDNKDDNMIKHVRKRPRTPFSSLDPNRDLP
ncbi:hypothetical protein F5Y10DRAFT_247548 [Nemania abortiva]|nr:hypothetical protein F5Y10DRAFT_247548 [Nemania abortiva]